MCVMSVMLRSFWALPLVKISICVTRNAAFRNLLTCVKISLTKAWEMIAVFCVFKPDCFYRFYSKLLLASWKPSPLTQPFFLYI